MLLQHTALSASEVEKETILQDYYTAFLSRQLSIAGRKEVHNGRAHFGIFGDGMEIAQIAYAKHFQKGDWRSGYYRDQTFMLAAGLLTPEEFFAQIYGDSNLNNNPSTGGRNFNNHFATSNYSPEQTINLLGQKNSTSDISPTAGQMPRLLGLAQASKMVRENSELHPFTQYISAGNEVAFGSIGDSSTSEGMFFETVNAACVMQLPIAIAVWDNGYGISVPVGLQTAKASISEALKGFAGKKGEKACRIFRAPGHDYPKLIETFGKGISVCRNEQVPVIFHIDELTQPLGHSTSGSHERYKSAERIEWEKNHDCLLKFGQWIVDNHIADRKTIEGIETRAIERVKQAKELAWENFTNGYKGEIDTLNKIINKLQPEKGRHAVSPEKELRQLFDTAMPTLKKLIHFADNVISKNCTEPQNVGVKQELKTWIKAANHRGKITYNTYLFNETPNPVQSKKCRYPSNPEVVPGHDLLNRNFDALFEKNPLMVTFGEDTGRLGDVNQGMKNMQHKYGEHRVSDTGIRETTIIGQGIGLALRGFRPIAEIQYLDYLLYALPTISDDLATLHYRTVGRQIAPLIIRTRGHQLQGMWHAGSPMSLILGSCRGIWLCVPRNMTQAAAYYNFLINSHNPAIVIEPLKGYYAHERIPENLGEFGLQPGVAEIIQPGDDITVVTYGWMVTIAHEAALKLKEYDISVELIDVQSLSPFDTEHLIGKSVKKTSKVLFVDEDVPGGGSAYMMQKAMEEQELFYYLDTPPRTLSATEHRGAYGVDGEYFSKPNIDSIFATVYRMMHDVDEARFKEEF